MPAYHIIAIVHFVLFSIIYYHLIKDPTLRKIILLLIIPFIAFSVVNTFYNQSFLLSFPSNSVLLSEAVYIFYTLLLFRQMLLNPVLIPLYKQSVFWFNIAMLIFSAVTLFNLGMINYFNKHNIDTSLLDSIIYIISLSFYGLFGYALFINNKFDGENSPHN
ncbi:hypothetical protein [Mucilaginibacter glaciei]|uniref:Uncharacterized protein n=1 Tax=Mucilaginibacter glaciei TaxID=2772109 RepID=A0A926NT62_9SPHI|nr:hypothetical protein [Mucilaginibacter glaciei]MBD1393510.1 hypothetical protein [Mucilaginibacter glaciei]